MKIKELMAADVEALDPEATLEQAAQQMADADVGGLPVVRDRRVLGFLTDRDIVARAVAEGLPPSETKVRQIMTSDVIGCGENDDVGHAAQIMAANRVRRLVVIDSSGALCGMVALADLASADAGAVRTVLQSLSLPDDEPGSGVYSGGPAEADRGTAPQGAAALVRDELAAAETYKQALQTVKEGPAGDALRRIENEHEEAARLLKRAVPAAEEERPAAAWSRPVEGADAALDEKAALRRLKEGEERDVRDYESALRNDSLDEELRSLIATRLLPATRAHIPVLDRFLSEGLGG